MPLSRALAKSGHPVTAALQVMEAFSKGPFGVPTKRDVMALTNVKYNINHAWFSDMPIRVRWSRPCSATGL